MNEILFSLEWAREANLLVLFVIALTGFASELLLLRRRRQQLSLQEEETSAPAMVLDGPRLHA